MAITGSAAPLLASPGEVWILRHNKNNGVLCLLCTPQLCPAAVPQASSLTGAEALTVMRPGCAGKRRSSQLEDKFAAPRPPCSPGLGARAVTSASRDAGGSPGGNAAGPGCSGRRRRPPPHPAPRSPCPSLAAAPRPTSAARSPALSAPRRRP